MTKEVEAIDPALVARMEAMLRRLAEVDYNTTGQYFAKNTVENARTIVAALPKPVDSDLIEARKVAEKALTCDGQSVILLHAIARGDRDDWPEVRIALAAIKRGRELAQVSA